MCIRSTLHGVIAHTNLYWSNQRAPGRAAGIAESKDVNFGLTASS
jgi:hypothetical protein